MAQVIKIKRSTGTSAPGTLAVGELAYSKGSDTLYVGDPATANTPIAIGGAIKNNAGTPVLATGITADEIASLLLPAISTSVTFGDATDVTLTTAGGLTVTGDLTVNGTTTTVNSTTTTVDDPIFTIGGDSAPGSDDNKDRGIEFRWHDGSSAKVGFFGFDDSTGKFTFIPDATNSSEVFSGTAGTVVANLEGTADVATSVTASANNSTDETVYPTFVDGATGSQGIETDTGLTYNPSTGTLTSTIFTGNLTGNVTGDLIIGGHTVSDIDIGSEFNDVDDHLMSAGAIKEKIEAYGYGVGDITQVVISSTDSSVTGTGTGASGNISFDLQVGTIDGGTY